MIKKTIEYTRLFFSPSSLFQTKINPKKKHTYLDLPYTHRHALKNIAYHFFYPYVLYYYKKKEKKKEIFFFYYPMTIKSLFLSALSLHLFTMPADSFIGQSEKDVPPFNNLGK